MEAHPRQAEKPGDVMRGRRVALTRLKAENLQTHFEWNNDEELHRLDSELPYVRETLPEFRHRFEQMVADALPAWRYLEIHEIEGALIGIAFVGEISEHNRHCSIGLTIGDRSFWGQGYGRASLELLLEYCFDELAMHRVGTETFVYNEPWRRLIRSVGFRKEGAKREYLRRDGRFWEKELYSMIEDEYRSWREGASD